MPPAGCWSSGPSPTWPRVCRLAARLLMNVRPARHGVTAGARPAGDGGGGPAYRSCGGDAPAGQPDAGDRHVLGDGGVGAVAARAPALDDMAEQAEAIGAGPVPRARRAPVVELRSMARRSTTCRTACATVCRAGRAHRGLRDEAAATRAPGCSTGPIQRRRVAAGAVDADAPAGAASASCG